MRALGSVSLSLALLLALGCSGAQGSDPDLHADAAKDTKTSKDTRVPADDTEGTDTASDDTGATGDTGGDDTGEPDTGVVDTGPDTPTCTGGDKEPNDDMASAIGLKSIDDCDGSGGSITGILDTNKDIDFYKYAGSDTFGCVVDPTMLGSTALKLCVYVKCTSGTSTTFKSCMKGIKNTIGGIDGCCGDGGAQIDYTCPATGTSDSATVWMSVSTAGVAACLPYTVTYHF